MLQWEKEKKNAFSRQQLEWQMPGNKNESSRYPLELTGKRYKCECPLTVG